MIPRSGYILARDQSMVESGVREGGKNTASFLFYELTQQHKHGKKKAMIFKVIPEEKQQLVGEKDADNIRNRRKVLCKSFIQWFGELNLCYYKYRVDCFGSLRLLFCCCCSESLEI